MREGPRFFVLAVFSYTYPIDTVQYNMVCIPFFLVCFCVLHALQLTLGSRSIRKPVRSLLLPGQCHVSLPYLHVERGTAPDPFVALAFTLLSCGKRFTHFGLKTNVHRFLNLIFCPFEF